MSSDRVIRATYRRFVSDGNYGTEGAELTLERIADADNDSAHEDFETADELLTNARTLVLAKLRESLNPTVRLAAGAKLTPNRPTSAAATAPDDDDERLPF